MTESSSVASATRYYYLDAFRAWAVLLGIVLHAAWIMLPFVANTPMADIDGGEFPNWVFWFIHLFRMQAFFLVAGFFGSMVYQRYGFRGFLRHRFVRIVLPLIVGWIFLFPWMRYYYTWGGLISGMTLTEASFWESYVRESAIMFVVVGSPMLHLWFLYDLILLYAATLILKAIFDRAFSSNHEIHRWIGEKYRQLILSPANIYILAIPCAALLLPMKMWIGVEGYPDYFLPDWNGFLAYWIFFGVGWLLYSQQDLLKAFHLRWRFNLLLGVLLSFPILGFYSNYVRPQITFAYPAVTVHELVDYPLLRQSLKESSSDNAQAIMSRLSPAWQTFLKENESIDENQLAGLVRQLTFQVVFGEALNKDFQNTDVEAVALANRKILEEITAGAISTEMKMTGRNIFAKTIFSIFYAVAMWSLVFGFLGLFHHYFHNPSPSIRYISDSSYWLYLLHLPVIFWLLMYLGTIELGTFAKFCLYNVVTVAILLPTYHYFVRSTIIGKWLNGRSYPYKPFFQSDLFRTRDQVTFEAIGTVEKNVEEVLATGKEALIGGVGIEAPHNDSLSQAESGSDDHQAGIAHENAS